MSDPDGRPVGEAGRPAAAGGAPADGPLEVLLRVQDFDTNLAQLLHRKATLPERAQLDDARARLSTIEAREAELVRQRGALLERQAEIERQVATVSARRRTMEDRMYAARGPDVRDLQAMGDEVAHLTQRRAELEDAELEVMVEQEPIDAELARLGEERTALGTAAGSLATALLAAEAVIDAEAATVSASRALEADRLPAELRQRYEALRAKLGGVGASRLIGNRCSGCHLELPSVEVDRIRHLPPGTVATCDQCGRLLVRVPAAPR